MIKSTGGAIHCAIVDPHRVLIRLLFYDVFKIHQITEKTIKNAKNFNL